ncbi:MAG TPA: glycoside hydrolase family 3 N-terminal domain-containing protein [Longimicrobiaceae bacterium]|nr:glycoside hydrolase family 3 N-terminal domain-containing protein [Longimicrobiaceae bacterium]
MPFRDPDRSMRMNRIHRGAIVVLCLAPLASAPRIAVAQAVPLYRDARAPVDARVSDLLARMTLEEKVAQLEAISLGRDLDSLEAGGRPDRYGPPGARLGFGAVTGLGFAGRGGPAARAEVANRVQRYFVEETRLGIPVLITDEALHGVVAQGATNYPTPLALASTFDTALVHRVFGEIGLEAALVGSNLVLSPVLDLAQDPRWGRTEETYGEDPYLNSRMGVAAITGYQGATAPFIDRRHVAATTKHFAGHGTPEGGRNIGPVHMSEVELRNYPLRPFEAAVREAHVAAVMPEYNEVLDVPAHANPFLLTTVLRDEWGFQGLVVSDFFGVRYLFDTHRVARDSAEAARLAVTAGVDIDMPELASYRNLVSLVRQGRLDEAVIDRSVRRVLRMKFLLGLFDHPYVDPAEAERVVGSEEHLATARRVAGEGMVLLKNEGGTLPLDPARIRTIALIGPHSDFAERGNYSGMPASTVTPLEAVRERLGGGARVLHAEGVRLLQTGGGARAGAVAIPGQRGASRLAPDSTNRRLIAEAVGVAKQADVVVLALGATAGMMREAWPGREGDNADLDPRGMQNELVDSIRATGKPMVVLLFSGGPLTFTHIDGVAPAIVYCWYLGQETGHAVADVLFGDVDPSGRLPLSIARSAGQLPVYYNHKPSARRQGYIFEDSSPLYPFGYGLSYTTFRIGNVRLSADSIAVGDSVQVLADVTNTGTRAGTAVVQLYIREDNTIPTRPVKELKDFARVPLAAGETRSVRMSLTPRKLGQYLTDGTFAVQPGEFHVMVGSSSRDADLSTVELEVRARPGAHRR